ncbi:MAG: hypothetical protein N4A65_07745, partial [Cohaesibacter sp.]|nr:hypothetical protein [Cohaesibacter sp.]
MADEKSTPSAPTPANRAHETHQAHNSIQKAEADKSANAVHDYDTGEVSAARQDILNPTLHFGLGTQEELLIPDYEAGPG